jgi:hypothetical protein
MRTKGVCYDVGIVMGMNWRPHFNPVEVRRELEIIQKDLHCSAVRICGRDLRRLVTAAESGLNLGLEVWLSPTLWNCTAEQTAAYMARGGRRNRTSPTTLAGEGCPDRGLGDHPILARNHPWTKFPRTDE